MLRLSKRKIAAAVLLVIAVAVWTATRQRLRASAPQPRLIASGRFHQVAHRGAGTASIYRLADNKLVLRFTNFRTDEGKELQVYLIAAADALENETVENSEHISLGELQLAEGDQVYELPDDIDLSRYHAVTVWGRKHRVNFTTAPLAPAAE